MAGAQDVMPKIVMILNIIVGCLGTLGGLILLLDFFDNSSDIENLFLPLCTMTLSVGLILLEIGVWRYGPNGIYANFGFSKWYAGRGFFVML